MESILLVGAGKIGATITEFLASSGHYHVTVADSDDTPLSHLSDHGNVTALNLDVRNVQALCRALDGKYAVLSALPFDLTRIIAEQAVKQKVHYFDLTEDVACTRLVKTVAGDAESALVPQCGLAPGFVSIVAYDLCKRFSSLKNVHLRVGALPRYPSNALKYNLTWSTDGLINEYCNPCEAISNGSRCEMPALEEVENFAIDGVNYEAFNTSGGLGTLCETLEDRVCNLNYRTIRYPGHRNIMKLLLHDLRLGERRDVLKDILEHAVPVTYQDVVMVFVSVSGEQRGRFVQETFVRKIYASRIGNKAWSAIQITTAAGICAMLDLLRNGKLPSKGFVRQEDADFNDFISNRFGQLFLGKPEVDIDHWGASAA